MAATPPAGLGTTRRARPVKSVVGASLRCHTIWRRHVHEEGRRWDPPMPAPGPATAHLVSLRGFRRRRPGPGPSPLQPEIAPARPALQKKRRATSPPMAKNHAKCRHQSLRSMEQQQSTWQGTNQEPSPSRL